MADEEPAIAIEGYIVEGPAVGIVGIVGAGAVAVAIATPALGIKLELVELQPVWTVEHLKTLCRPE